MFFVCDSKNKKFAIDFLKLNWNVFTAANKEFHNFKIHICEKRIEDFFLSDGQLPHYGQEEQFAENGGIHATIENSLSC